MIATRPPPFPPLTADLERPPTGLFWLNGQLVARRTGLVQPHQLTCRHGHRLRIENIYADGGVHCGNLYARHDGPHIATERDRCHAALYTVMLRPEFGPAWVFAADTNRIELTFWERSDYTVADVFAYLGVRL